MAALSYKGYVASVEFDAAAAQLVGRVLNARDTMDFRAEGASEVLDRFHAIIDEYLADCERDGVEPQKPYSGKLLLRIAPALHGELAASAVRAGQSINTFAQRAIERAVAESG